MAIIFFLFFFVIKILQLYCEYEILILHLSYQNVKIMKTLTYKDFKSQSVYGNEVEFLMKDGTTVYVNTEDNTVEIEDELIIDADYEYYLQAAIEVLAENEARESEKRHTDILQYHYD